MQNVYLFNTYKIVSFLNVSIYKKLINKIKPINLIEEIIDNSPFYKFLIIGAFIFFLLQFIMDIIILVFLIKKKKIQLLKDSDYECLNIIFENIPNPIILFKKNNKSFSIINYNKAALKLFKNKKIKINHDINNLFYNPDIINNIFKAYNKKTEFTLETEFLKNKKNNISLLLSIKYIPNDMILLEYRDITNDKIYEKIIKQNENLLNAIIDNVQALLILINKKGIINFFQGKILEKFGVKSSDMQGKSIYDYKNNYPGTIKLINETLKGKTIQDIIKLNDNHLRIQFTPFYNQKKIITGAVGIVTDITEQINLQNNLLESEATLKSILGAIPTGIGMVIDRNIIWINDKLCEMLGYSCNELEGKNAIVLYPSKKEYEFVGREKYDQIKKYGTGSVETKFKHKKGKILDVILSSTPLDINDLSKGVIFTVIDITERKDNEIYRDKLLKTLALKNEELENILSIASHDLRSPLVNIQGFTKELNYILDDLKNNLIKNNKTKKIETIFDNDINEALKYINNGITKIDQTINGLLKLSRLGKESLKIIKINPEKIIKNIISSMQFQINEKKIKFNLEKLPNCYADELQLNQIFTNLIDNAIKYSKEGQKCYIKISGNTNNQYSIYCIEDNGIGIPKNYHTKIFEVFQRLNPYSKESGEGLGLALVKKIIHRLNGKIWVESEPNAGSKFYIAIPNEKYDIIY